MKVLNYTGLQNLWTNIRNYITAHTPTKTSDLTNDSNFVDTSNSAVASGITSAKVTSYDSHIADTDIHVTTADKNKWNNGVSQSYVLRYSSSSVTDNSTIAFSTLDNTDNIKSGDKVIGADGKIFSVVSIDTANQTVTVGTALIDLALDANVVHTSGNETVGGTKNFSNRTIFSTTSVDSELTLKQNAYDPATNGQSALSSTCSFNVTARSVTNGSFAQIGFYGAPGFTTTRLNCRYYTGASESEESWVEYTVTGTSGSITGRSFKPYNNGLVDLGTNANRWKSVYAANYYYGSNNVEFSTKFVTTDTNQTISGEKTFSSSLRISNSDTTVTTPDLNLKNYKVDRGTTDTGVQAIQFLDKNGKALTTIESRRISNGNTATNILCYNTDDSNNTVSGGIAIIKGKNDTSFAPNTDNAVNCGRALAKWSDVQTYKVNTLEPSSLSLPSGNVSDIIDISSYITDMSGIINNYTAPANGWISILMNNSSGIQAFINGLWGHQIVRPSAGVIRFLMPVVKNLTVNILIFGGTIDNARFIPCQGNV